MAKSSMKN